jgi:mono/diheme cytochrome c family protein
MPYTTEDIAAIISNGVKNMPGFADRLSAEEIAEVAALCSISNPEPHRRSTKPT